MGRMAQQKTEESVAQREEESEIPSVGYNRWTLYE